MPDLSVFIFLVLLNLYRIICKSSKKDFVKKSLNVPNVKLLSIYSIRESSVQFLKQNVFLTYFWGGFRTKILEQLEFKLEKIIGIYKPTGKVRFGARH